MILKSIKRVAQREEDERDVDVLDKQYRGLFNNYILRYSYLGSYDDLNQECMIVLIKACRAYSTYSVPFFAFLKKCLSNHFSHLLNAHYRPCRNLAIALSDKREAEGYDSEYESDLGFYEYHVSSLEDITLDSISSSRAMFSGSGSDDPVDMEIFQEDLERIEGRLTDFGIKIFREMLVPTEKTYICAQNGFFSNGKDYKITLRDIAESLEEKYSRVYHVVRNEIRPVVAEILLNGEYPGERMKSEVKITKEFLQFLMKEVA